jgi:tRNA G10  N-methylase Trm11
MTTLTESRHPAAFNAAVLFTCDSILAEEEARLDLPAGLRVLDPFAGIGRVHRLPGRTVGVELELEWARQAPMGSAVGDALHLPFADSTFDVLVTSPCYGNRMADHHEAQDACSECGGIGYTRPDSVAAVDCKACGGSGLSRRNTYRHALGRPLTKNSGAAMQWGSDYRRFHEAAWCEALRVLRPEALILCNVKNHIRGGIEQPVVEWHANMWMVLGSSLHSAHRIGSRGLRQGANGDARIDAEILLVFRAPPKTGSLFTGH